MAHVVFLRAANVGGNNVFRPTQLVSALAHLDITNIGAAGTFVVHGKATASAIRAAILGELPFMPELVVRPAAEVVALVKSEPFAGIKFSKDLRGWIGAMSGKPAAQPELPFAVPATAKWTLRLDRVEGVYAIGLSQRQPDGPAVPANAIAKALGVSLTTRWWETFVRIAAVLEKHA